MAQPTSNLKIDDWRSRLRLDPKSRVFYPLAEELRKIGQWAESERVLRLGLEHHPTYLSAWVSLGRVLRDQHKDAEAIDALKKALQLDPGNVVAARLLGDAFLTAGDKIEAIKKYKLVLALMPGDQEVETLVEGLERDLNPIVLATVSADEQAPARDSAEPAPALPQAAGEAASPEAPGLTSPFDEPGSLGPVPGAVGEPTPFAVADHPMDETRPQPRPQAAEPSAWSEPEPYDHQPTIETPFTAGDPEISKATVPETKAATSQLSTGDEEPMLAGHRDSPFEEPSGYTSDALTVEQPRGMHLEEEPEASSAPSMWSDDGAGTSPSHKEEEVSPWSDEVGPVPGATQPSDDEGDPSHVFASSAEEPADREEVTDTLTMADLYVRQGQPAQAREIYDRILERDPGNADVMARRAALHAAAPAAMAKPVDPRAEKLGRWLSKVGRREDGGV